MRDLEDYCGDKSGDLGGMSLRECHPIFQKLLDMHAFEIGYLRPKNITIQRFRGVENVAPDPESSSINFSCEGQSSSTSTSNSFKPLPRHLILQMDNSAKDNKNQTILAFCSDLVARGIFETITMSFLMVGHTHEDIDAAFSKVALRTKGKNIGTLPELMAEVWECMEEMHMVPSMITEVVAYKEYLQRYKVKQIVGHSAPVAFCFSMKDNKPIFQYKANNNSPWIPKNGRTIWAIDPTTKHLIVPIDDPYAKKMLRTYDKKDEVVPYIHKYIEHHLKGCADETSEAYRLKLPLVQYWKGVVEALEGEFGVQEDFLSESLEMSKLSCPFWPRTNHGTRYKA